MPKEYTRVSDFLVYVFTAIIWSIVFYFISKPLIALAAVWLAYCGAIPTRKNLSYSKNYLRPIVVGLIWGIVLGSVLYFLNTRTHSPLWLASSIYFLGFLTVCHVSYGHLLGIEALGGKKLKEYHLVSLTVSIIVYALSLLLLYALNL